MNNLSKHIIGGVLLLLLQILMFNHLHLFQVATPFVFLLFLFMLPVSIPTATLMIVAFVSGFIVDIFSVNALYGLHAFSAVLAVSLRSQVLALATPFSTRKMGETSFANQSMIWFAVYLAPLILIHHLAYFFLEAFTFDGTLFTLLRVVASFVYTFCLCYIFSFIFYKK